MTFNLCYSSSLVTLLLLWITNSIVTTIVIAEFDYEYEYVVNTEGLEEDFFVWRI